MFALKQKLRTYSDVSEEELKYTFQFFQKQIVPKGTFILEAGQCVEKLYFLETGCFVFYALSNEQEQVVEIFTENDLFTDFYSYLKQVPSKSYLRAVETSLIYGIKKTDFEEVFKKIHSVERFGRKFLEEEYLKLWINTTHKNVLSNEERYLELLKRRPTLFQRLPQYLIASYLGLTPVGLSKIRKRLTDGR
jgi:CRP-like cAMP-binding protein